MVVERIPDGFEQKEHTFSEGYESPDGSETMISIVIPLYNQVAYTQLCVQSLRRAGLNGVDVLLIDNGSTDGTAEYLKSCSDLRVIRNRENLGCAGAWNQGVRETTSEWVMILNNDVVVSPGWLDGLLEAAGKEGLDVVSPAIREGEYNYDIEGYSQEFVGRMGDVVRRGVADGICFMVRRRVFEVVGLFDENFRIGQFEDADFFRRARNAGFRLGTTGRSFIHHFGSVTQDAIRKNRPERPYVAENRAYFREKWQLTRGRRLIERWRRKLREFAWQKCERMFHGHTLKEKWLGGRLRYY
ncbi:glycosyl transferase family 2 [Geobacter metallireducens RCH3]|nr:glycosyl transferase family 2 [Geobacter metallireducens RCH3]